MGLDQQAYTKDKDGQCISIQDWRKHNALDGWMQNLWVAKGGTGDWNCAEVELTQKDLDCLKWRTEEDELPETVGFFYGGDSRGCPYRKQETLDFIKEAGKLLSKGEKVYYSAWF